MNYLSKFLESFEEDREKVDRFVKDCPAHIQTLDSIIASDHVDTSQVNSLVDAFRQITPLFGLPGKYGRFGSRNGYDLDDLYTGLTTILARIGEADTKLSDSIDHSFYCIFQDWKAAKKEFASWSSGYGLGDLAEKRQKLDSLAESYSSLIEITGTLREIFENREIESYSQFSKSLGEAGTSLAEVKSEFDSPQQKTKSELNVLRRRLAKIEDGLKSRSSKARHKSGLFSRSKIFDYPKEEAEIISLAARLDSEISDYDSIKELKKKASELGEYLTGAITFLSGEPSLAESYLGEFASLSDTNTQIESGNSILEELRGSHHLSQQYEMVDQLLKKYRELYAERQSAIQSSLGKELALVDSKVLDQESGNKKGALITLKSSRQKLGELAGLYSLLGSQPEEIGTLSKRIDELISHYEAAFDNDIVSSLSQAGSTPAESANPHYTSGGNASAPSLQLVKRGPQPQFNMSTYLMRIGFPPRKYLKLMDILVGNTGIQDRVERLKELEHHLGTLAPASSTQELDYLNHLQYSLTEDMNRGRLGFLITRNSQYWQDAHSALSSLGEYITSSETSLGLSSGECEAHRALSGQKNSYNSMVG